MSFQEIVFKACIIIIFNVYNLKFLQILIYTINIYLYYHLLNIDWYFIFYTQPRRPLSLYLFWNSVSILYFCCRIVLSYFLLAYSIFQSQFYRRFRRQAFRFSIQDLIELVAMFYSFFSIYKMSYSASFCSLNSRYFFCICMIYSALMSFCLSFTYSLLPASCSIFFLTQRLTIEYLSGCFCSSVSWLA